MGNIQPFLQRRGGRYFFRIQVPTDLRDVVGTCELTKTLGTGERAAAVPLALELGATAKRLFLGLRRPFMTSDDTLKLLRAARAKLQLDSVEEAKDQEIDQARRDSNADRREMQARVDTMERALAVAVGASQATMHPAPAAQLSTAPVAVYEPLRTLVDAFLAAYPKDRKAQMFKKHQAALGLLRELFGGKPVNQLRQSDVVDYFEVVAGLPPRWAEKCAKLKVSVRELAGQVNAVRLGKKSFDDNYKVPIRLFLRYAVTNWQDQGFPTTLTTAGIEFDGEDDEGKNKQRAMTTPELKRLFHGPELTAFRVDPAQVHKWWLPVLAFYTGARVNEMAQLNPQTDVLVDPASGVNYILISETTEGDDRIKKSVKTKQQRAVPLHPDMIEGGFCDYVAGLKKQGSKLLFPAWNPNKQRASIQAERWFRDFLAEIGVRNDTPGAKVVGFHALRHTFLTRAANSSPPVDAGPITGHVDPSKSAVQRGYEGELSVVNKLALLKAMQFNFRPGRPIGGTATTP